MKAQDYWENYVYETDAEEIERNIRRTTFKSRGLDLSLKYFEKDKNAANILWVIGTGCYSLYLAELGYHMHLRGYNTFGIDFQGHGDSEGRGGDFTVNELVENCVDAVEYIRKMFNDRIGTVGVSLGGFVTFYLGLRNEPIKSIACLDAGILTEKEFQNEVTKFKKIPPAGILLAKLMPKKKISTASYVDFWGLAETEKEKKLVEAYMNDSNIVKHYTLRGVISQITTPPPRPIEQLNIPTMFIVPKRDRLLSVDYMKNLFDRLPNIKKRLVEIDGSHYWLSSHPKEAAEVICDWFDETL